MALLALTSSIYNVYLQRQQVRAQVLPSLEWTVHWKTGEEWSFVISNHGVGPATIERMRVRVDGEPVPTWLGAERALLRRHDVSLGVTHKALVTMNPGSDITAFLVPDPMHAANLFLERRRLGVELCYCSTLDDCWSAGGKGVGSDAPVPVANCAPDPSPFVTFDEQGFDDIARTVMAELSDAAPPDAGHD